MWKGGQPGPGEVSFPPLGFNLLVGRMPRVEAVQPLPRPGSGPLNSSVSLRGWSPRPDSRPRLLRLPSPTLTGPSRRGEPRSLSSIRPAEHPPHGEVHVGAPVRCVPLRRPRRRGAVWACVFACHPVDSLRGRSDEGTPSSLRRGRCAQKHTGAGTQGMCVCVAGRRACGWQRVDASAWLCAGLWMLLHLCVYRHYLGCLHARSLVCVCVTSHLRPAQKQEDAFWWHVEAPGSRPPVATTTHLFSFSFFFIHF